MDQAKREAYARRLDALAARLVEIAAVALALARDMRAGPTGGRVQPADVQSWGRETTEKPTKIHMGGD